MRKVEGKDSIDRSVAMVVLKRRIIGAAQPVTCGSVYDRSPIDHHLKLGVYPQDGKGLWNF